MIHLCCCFIAVEASFLFKFRSSLFKGLRVSEGRALGVLFPSESFLCLSLNSSRTVAACEFFYLSKCCVIVVSLYCVLEGGSGYSKFNGCLRIFA